MNEVTLRKLMLRVPERQWQSVLLQFETFKLATDEPVRSKAPTDDTREFLRWLENPKRHVGKLRTFLNELADGAARHLSAANLWTAEERPTESADWNEFLDAVAAEFSVDFARVCLLGAPALIDWTPSARSDAHGTIGAAVEDLDSLDELLQSAREAAHNILQALDSAKDCVLDARGVSELLGARSLEWNSALDALSTGLHGSVVLPGGGLDSFAGLIDERRRLADEVESDRARLATARSELDYLNNQIESAPPGLEVQIRSMAEAKLEEILAIEAGLRPLATDADTTQAGTEQIEPEDIKDPIDDSGILTPTSSVDELLLNEPVDPESQPEPHPRQPVADMATDDDSDDSRPTAPETASEKDTGGRIDSNPSVTTASYPESEYEPPTFREGVADAEAALGTLVKQGKWAAAASVVGLTSIEPARRDALLYTAEAFTLPLTVTDARELLVRNLEARTQAVSQKGTQEAILTSVATLRTCLQLGQNDYTLLDDSSFDSLSPGWRDALRTLRNGLSAGYRHRWERSVGREVNSQPARIRTEATRLKDALPHRKISLQRATRVLQHLIKPEEPLGRALSAVIGWADGEVDVSELRALSSVLSDPESVIKAADAVVATTQQIRKPIVSRSLETLVLRIADVSSVVDRAIEADSRRSGDQAANNVHIYDQVKAAVGQIPDVPEDSTLASAALNALRDWLVEGPPSTHLDEVSFQNLMFLESLPAVSVARDEQTGLPMDGDVDIVLTEILEPKDQRTLFSAYLDSGNFAAAAALATSEDEAELSVRGRDWSTTIRKRTQDLQALMMRTQAQLGMDEGEQASIEAHVASLESIPRGRFDVATRRANAIESRIMSKWNEDEVALRERLRQLSSEFEISDDNRERIARTIAEHDLITAHEFLSYVENRTALPQQADASAGHLDEFRRLLSSLPTSIPNVVTQAETLGATDLPRRVEDGLRAWNLARNNARPSDWSKGLPQILGVLGLIHNRHVPITEINRPEQQRWAATFSVSATPTDGSHIAVLGSKVDRYTVTVVKPDASVESVLETIPPMARRAANLLLFPGVLTWSQRINLLTAARRRRTTILIVDTACIVFLAIRGAESFRLLQEITLPFAVFDHWAPRVAGDVPTELFVGRSREMDQIMSSGGSLFVYGGRQLGKSALLNRIRREFSNTPEHVAIYIDLKAAGIGNQNGPEHLWAVLRSSLVDEGVIAPKFKATDPQAITKHIRDWLDGSSSRRMLLLCDESDAFLENEARQTITNNRSVTFPNVMHLKGLMDSTERRFKPVFAGLHQVQRIGDVSNSPLAHGGRDILVGPLTPDEARDLVVRPFEVLGYSFKSLDLVWRLIAFTNYQAGLVQIVCDALIGHLRERPLKDKEPPYVITADDVDNIITDQSIREQIAERFMLTIRLEDRYFVTALTIALYSLEDSFQKRYSPEIILDGAAEWWREGFGSLNSTQFRFYLEEMIGLGVLMRGADGRYGMRSPNVVHMLGGREDIERRLIDGADRFELPVEYNPKVSRRLIPRHRSVRDRQSDRYSPLTEHDLSIALPKKDDGKSAFAVIGSKALGVEAVEVVLRDVIDDRGHFGLESINYRDRGRLVQNGAGPFVNRALLLCDVGEDQSATDEVVELIGRAAVRAIGRRGVILGPSAADRRAELEANAVNTIALQLWSAETLRATIENPVSDPELRDMFVDACGGWPLLCEQFLDRIRTGRSVTEVIEEATNYPNSRSDATQFLNEVGLTDHDTVSRLANLAHLVDFDEEVDRETFAAIVDLDADDATSLADRLELLSILKVRRDSLVLNAVVVRSLRLFGERDDV